METAQTVYLEEWMYDRQCGWLQRWMCEPPDPGISFQVLRQEWTTDEAGHDVRIIHEIRRAETE